MSKNLSFYIRQVGDDVTSCDNYIMMSKSRHLGFQNFPKRQKTA